MTKDELDFLLPRLLAKWQGRLRLLDWDVSIICDVGETKPDWGALIQVNEFAHQARIYYPPDGIERFKSKRVGLLDEPEESIVERSVIHELLHLVARSQQVNLTTEIEWAVGRKGILGFNMRSAWSDYQEYWINQLAGILQTADQGGWVKM